MNYHNGAQTGFDFWPHTRIRRRGMAGYRNIRMRGFFKKAAVYLAIFFLFALAYVWARVQVIETGYRLRRLEENREKMKEENHALTVEAATLRAPQRLEKLAADMELRRPTDKQIFYLNDTRNEKKSFP